MSIYVLVCVACEYACIGLEQMNLIKPHKIRLIISFNYLKQIDKMKFSTVQIFEKKKKSVKKFFQIQ